MEKPLLHIIEDDSDMRLVIVDTFVDDFRIIESADGLSGFKTAATENPSIIISDIVMPGMDGISLCKKLKNDARTCHIPVVLLTGKDSEEEILEGLAVGADDYISKPFNTPILKVKIKNLVDARRTILNHLLLSSDVKQFGEEGHITNTEARFLFDAYKVVEKNLGNAAFDAQDFAKEIGMSRAQLYRKIQKVSGQSVKEFVRVVRLKKAAELLVSSGLNVSQVAYEVGFNSVAYFTKSFSEYFFQTPSKYMLQNKRK